MGDPDHLIRVIERWRSVGVGGINFILNASEILSQEQVLASLRLFAQEVMPKFGGGGRDRVDAPSTVPEGLGRC